MSKIFKDAKRWLFLRSGNEKQIGLKDVIKLYLTAPGFRFLVSHRMINALKKHKITKAFSLILWANECRNHGSEIAFEVELGTGTYTPHPYGIIIGKAEIHENVEILQNVTIGSISRKKKGVPILSEGCRIGAGAVILGDIIIGKNASVGANAVVLQSVPDNCVAVGNPARIIYPK